MPREKQPFVGDSVWVNTVNYRGVVARTRRSGKSDCSGEKKANQGSPKEGKAVFCQKAGRSLSSDPENYDLNIVLLSKGEDRKAAIKQMSKRHTDKVRVTEPDPE